MAEQQTEELIGKADAVTKASERIRTDIAELRAGLQRMEEQLSRQERILVEIFTEVRTRGA